VTGFLQALLLFIAIGIGAWLFSFVIEALRRKPAAPGRLSWAPDIPIQHVTVKGNRLRYIKTGDGPPLVLLHTLRTQLDLFQKIVPDLAKHFTVYAFDYPGHGYSDIPDARYDAAFFADTVEGFLEALDLRGVTLAGISIGGSLALILPARRNPRVTKAIAINPYDYAKGRGMARSSLAGWLVTYSGLVPFIGETVMRQRNSLIMKMVFNGGVADGKSIPPDLLREMTLVGNRPGHYRAFLNLLRHAESWEEATADYRNIDIPVLLIWGDKDWASPDEREHDRGLIPSVTVKTIADGGHFLSLDRPRELSEAIVAFAAGKQPGTSGSPRAARN
jgi:pimeloyl-ACP methyl ester carboxylesterase